MAWIPAFALASAAKNQKTSPLYAAPVARIPRLRHSDSEQHGQSEPICGMGILSHLSIFDNTGTWNLVVERLICTSWRLRASRCCDSRTTGWLKSVDPHSPTARYINQKILHSTHLLVWQHSIARCIETKPTDIPTICRKTNYWEAKDPRF